MHINSDSILVFFFYSDMIDRVENKDGRILNKSFALTCTMCTLVLIIGRKGRRENGERRENKRRKGGEGR